jgi:glycerol-3-phosphate acyltransferase PlsY
MPAAAVPLVILAYLVGTWPTAQLVASRSGVDPTATGSGNPGASNVTRLVGRRAGALVLAGDVGKGLVATLAGLAVGGRPLGLACGLAVVVGHIAPVTRWFRGGKGVATAAGAALVLWPMAVLALAVVWGMALAVGRRASVASIAAAASLPLVVWSIGGGPVDVVAAGVIAIAVIVRHRDNVTRLRRGEEPVVIGDR